MDIHHLHAIVLRIRFRRDIAAGIGKMIEKAQEIKEPAAVVILISEGFFGKEADIFYAAAAIGQTAPERGVIVFFQEHIHQLAHGIDLGIPPPAKDRFAKPRRFFFGQTFPVHVIGGQHHFPEFLSLAGKPQSEQFVFVKGKQRRTHHGGQRDILKRVIQYRKESGDQFRFPAG